jgi:hypothetical protein
MARVCPNLCTTIGEISHRAGHAALHPIEIAAIIVRQRFGARDAGKIESAFTRG